jgi:hypothetical protein
MTMDQSTAGPEETSVDLRRRSNRTRAPTNLVDRRTHLRSSVPLLSSFPEGAEIDRKSCSDPLSDLRIRLEDETGGDDFILRGVGDQEPPGVGSARWSIVFSPSSAWTRPFSAG